MKKFVIFFTILMLLPIFISATAHAQEKKPIQLSFFAPVQIYPETTPIAGVRLSLLYGKNTSVSGLDVGLVNHTTAGISKGFQLGLVGINEADFVGFQHNYLVNNVNGNCEGFQLGFVNITHNMNGFQLGFVNYAYNMKGLQIGLVNIIKQNGQFPVFPIVNWSF